MNVIKFKFSAFFSLLFLSISSLPVLTQELVMERDYVIHDRGMLHNTFYNTGEISQVWQRSIHFKVTVPYMKWPAYSRTVIDGREYDGHNNSFGGAILITANYLGDTGEKEEDGRLGAFCGGVGKGEPEPAFGEWSFPVSLEQWENYPVLEDGTLNPNFDPEEAEQISKAVWNTNIGIQCTRVSRSWSYPDYDDLIIHEYTLENNGVFYDKEQAKLVKKDTTLVDVLICFNYGLSPSQLGNSRYSDDHYWELYDKNYSPTSYFDHRYWLQYNQITNQHGDTLKAGFPEPFLENFKEFAETGKNGGGLLSPQAVGFSVLYYDTDRLSIIDTSDASRNQSEQYIDPALDLMEYNDDDEWIDIGPDDKIKQPYFVYSGKDPCQRSKIWDKIANFAKRWGDVYKGPDLDGNRILPDIWIGRYIPWVEGNQVHPTRAMDFGLYYLRPGEKIEFTIAEVAGFGADPEADVIGGWGNEDVPVRKGWFWDRPVEVEGQIVTENYVADYGIPDYVNSDVVYVQDVAHKALEAYVGHEISDPDTWDENNPLCWPENNPKDGVYKVPIPIPAPAIETVNTDTGTVVVNWKRHVENFENMYPNHISGKLATFDVYRADAKMGPWEKLGSVTKGDVTGDEYVFVDKDRTFYVEETKYYSVVSMDEYGNKSGKTNITEHKKAIGPASELSKVIIVPNPFVVESGFEGIGAERMLGIYGLPEKCTIYIYSFAGQRVFTIEHEAQEYSDNWEQITRNNQDLASGLYFFVVKTPEGKKVTGKFLVIK